MKIGGYSDTKHFEMKSVHHLGMQHWPHEKINFIESIIYELLTLNSVVSPYDLISSGFFCVLQISSDSLMFNFPDQNVFLSDTYLDSNLSGSSTAADIVSVHKTEEGSTSSKKKGKAAPPSNTVIKSFYNYFVVLFFPLFVRPLSINDKSKILHGHKPLTIIQLHEWCKDEI